ncbi:hypothetical protein GIB67_009762 [Kingdonia uniflora]|uniref:RNase H type-1 domain-containing protein n=1 Tax=Kingdonia uniflora TaxID=39325 RepID=A0A7J7LBA9_9MAGN|nr:hypothetical protein GIB67_009762 [Kingdonia uniflora]
MFVIWNSKNELLFENKRTNPDEVLKKATLYTTPIPRTVPPTLPIRELQPIATTKAREGHSSTRAANPEEAEAISVIRGMETTLSLGLDRIILLTDCQRLVQAFRDHSEDFSWGALTWAPDMYALAARFQTFFF